jgi:2-C-methyl-D-erythritol 2,4-cyclodiphosphate synthase
VSAFRVGTGFDAHRLVPGRPLRLGGVALDFPRGLEGHSDGDCLVHALCDALLGAMAAGELGQRFPSSDPQWRDASSLVFLTEVVRLVGERGFVVEKPRLAPHTPAMRERLSQCLGIPQGAVSVKAKSTDGLGAIGRSEGIAAQASVLLRAKD